MKHSDLYNSGPKEELMPSSAGRPVLALQHGTRCSKVSSLISSGCKEVVSKGFSRILRSMLSAAINPSGICDVNLTFPSLSLQTSRPFRVQRSLQRCLGRETVFPAGRKTGSTTSALGLLKYATSFRNIRIVIPKAGCCTVEVKR